MNDATPPGARGHSALSAETITRPAAAEGIRTGHSWGADVCIRTVSGKLIKCGVDGWHKTVLELKVRPSAPLHVVHVCGSRAGGGSMERSNALAGSSRAFGNFLRRALSHVSAQTWLQDAGTGVPENAMFLVADNGTVLGEDDRILRTYGLPSDTILQQMLLL